MKSKRSQPYIPSIDLGNMRHLGVPSSRRYSTTSFSQIVRAASSCLISWLQAAAYQTSNGYGLLSDMAFLPKEGFRGRRRAPISSLDDGAHKTIARALDDDNSSRGAVASARVRRANPCGAQRRLGRMAAPRRKARSCAHHPITAVQSRPAGRDRIDIYDGGLPVNCQR
jgi:hypothetical protein